VPGISEVVSGLNSQRDFQLTTLRFAWAKGLWSSIAANSQFTLQELTDFFACGSPSLRSLRIEEIIVIEPLGKALSIPLRFAQSYEVRVMLESHPIQVLIEGRISINSFGLAAMAPSAMSS
jgi:hypothetical protein